ncbi:MAG: hypothetical protein EOP09_06100, partial [Proteobacteria bacterium]
MQTPQQSQTSESSNELSELIKDIKITMLTVADGEGAFMSRPMYPQEMDEAGDLWFFASEGSEQTMLIPQDGRVILNYAGTDIGRYVVVYGTGELSKDRAKMEALWSPNMKAWFPEGLEDPEICLIKITPESAEYWDTPG